jgi:hypothetical protein
VNALRLSELRPRTVWDIADDAFDLYRSRFALMGGIAAAAYVPAYLAYTAILVNHLDAVRRATTESEAAGRLFTATWESMLVGAPLFLVASTLHSAATAAAVSAELVHGERMSILAAYRAVLRRFFPLFLAMILSALAGFLGAIVFFIGALYVMVVLAFLPQAIQLEKKGVRGAFQRTQDLAKVEFGRVLGLLCLTGVLSQLLYWGLYLVTGFAVELLPLGSDVVLKQARQALLNQAVSATTGILLAPLYGIGMTLLYFDIRVRREGLDIVALAERIGFPLAPDPFGDMTSETARRKYFKPKRNRK